MNWLYKITQKPMPLDPEAYKHEPEPHRLQQHQESHLTPWGRVPNPQNPQNVEDLYKGVHATQDFDWAASYANNRAAAGDPPVVIEFATTQEWVNDVDALTDITDQLSFATQQVMELEGLKEYVNRFESSGRVDRAYLAEVFEEVSDMQYADMYEWESSYDDTVGDEMQRKAVRITADAIADFFKTYYPNNPVMAFYKGYLKPVIMGGEIDQRLYGHFHNQMRFMKAIKDDEIVRVYKITPWEGEIYNEYNEDDPSVQYLEERETEGVMRQLVNPDEIMNFSPQKELIWESLGQKPGATFYHGTSLSRAQSALPFLKGLS